MPFVKGEIPEGAKPFEPGKSGNPAGKPPGIKNRSTIARKVLEMRGLLSDEKMDKLKEKFPDIHDKMTVEEIMTVVMADNAIAGDDKHYKALMDSAYGAPKQEVAATIDGSVRLLTVDPLSHVTTDNGPAEDSGSTQED